MHISRTLRHLFFLDWQIQKAFSTQTLNAIKSAIQASERSNAGEIRFVVEGSLDSGPLFQGYSARERALEVFSELRVWDTELNNGVLIYVLLADRAVEIVADRGIQARAGSATWESICHSMELDFSRSEFLEGSIHGIASIAKVIAHHFPESANTSNELPDEPVLLM